MSGARIEGSATAFLAIFVFALLVACGLVVDGGRYIAARQAAETEAEQAARAGATSLSVDGLRNGEVEVDPILGIAAAENYMAAAGHSGTASVSGNQVSATVSPYSLPTALLMIVGFSHFSVSATATATNVHGVDRED